MFVSTSKGKIKAFKSLKHVCILCQGIPLLERFPEPLSGTPTHMAVTAPTARTRRRPNAQRSGGHGDDLTAR